MEELTLRGNTRKLVIVALVAFGIRLAVIPFTIGEWRNPRYLAQYEPGNVAIALIHGHGFGSPWRTGVNQPSAVVPPAYPLILAAIYRCFGINTETSIAIALVFDCMLSALVCIPIYLLTRNAFGQQAAIWAGWAWVFSPYGIYFAAEWPWPTHLLTLGICWLVYLAQRMAGCARLGLWVTFGLVAGLTALAEPSVLSVAAFLLCFCTWRLASNSARWLAPPASAAFVLIVTLSPWMIRNAIVFHRFIPMRSGLGLEMYIGNHPGTVHWSGMQFHPNHDAGELAEYRAGEMAFMDHKMQEARLYIGEHKLWYAIRCVRRAVYLWTGYWSFAPAYLAEEPMDVANIPLRTLLTLLGILGLVAAWQHDPQQAILFGGVLFFYPFLYYFVHPEAYRMCPLDPFLGALGYLAVRDFVADPVAERWRARNAETEAWLETNS